MGGVASSSCLLLLLLVLPLLVMGAPTASGVCGHGCHCYHSPQGGRAANCSRFETDLHKHHAPLPTDLRSLRVLPAAPGLSFFLEEALLHHGRHLKELYLADNEVVGPRLRSLRGLQKLHVLDLSFCDVSDPSLMASLLKHSNSLESLRLSGNSLTSVPTLVSNTLTDLDMSDCGIVSVQVDAFSRLKRLHRLNLARNRLSNLAADLPTSLRFLDLSGNALTHLSPKLVRTLHRVDVAGNPLHCTCELLRLRDVRWGEHVAVGAGAVCTAPEQMRGLSLSGARRVCENRELLEIGTASRQRRQADPLDLVEGSGGGEGDGVGEDDEWDDDTVGDDDYYDEADDGTETDSADGAAVPAAASTETESPASHSGTEFGSPNTSTETSSSASSTSSTAAPSVEDNTRSLEDDIYEPTVPPPVPAAVDAAAAAVPPSETPPESGPPAAAVVEGNNADSSPSKADNIDDTEALSESKGESETITTSPVIDSEVAKPENVGKEEEVDSTKTEVHDAINEVMGSENGFGGGAAGTEEEEDYDYDDLGDPIANSADPKTSTDKPDTAKEGDKGLSPLETAAEEGTSDSISTSNSEEEAGIEESVNEVKAPEDVMSVPPAAESNKTASTPLDEVHPEEESHTNTDDDGIDMAEAEGSGEGDDDESVPIGPITGFLDLNSQKTAPTTTEAPDEGTLVIDDEEAEEEENNSPLIPPAAEDTSETVLTYENRAEVHDVKYTMVSNETENETGVNVEEYEDGEEGSGVPMIVGSEDWEVGGTNETDKTVETTSSGPFNIEENDVIVHRVSEVGSERELSSSSESPLTTSTSEGPGAIAHGGLFRLNLPQEEDATTTEAPVHTEPPAVAGVGVESSSTEPPVPDVVVKSADTEGDIEEPISTAAPVPVVEEAPVAVPSEEPVETSPSYEVSPAVTSEVLIPELTPEWDDSRVLPEPAPGADDQDETSEVETVAPTGDAPYNDTARVVVAGGDKAEETPLNSAGSYVVLGIIMALVVFLLGYAVMRSRRGRQRRAAKSNGKDAEAAAGQQEGRELKEISKPLLGTPATVPAANGKGDHLQPLVTKPADNPDLKDDDADELMTEKPLLEPSPKIHVYETVNGGEKERVPVHPPSPKKSPVAVLDAAPTTKDGEDGDAVDLRAPPVPEKRRVLSRLPETAVDGAPNMYAADGLPGEVVSQPAVNGSATPPANGLSTFAPPVSPSSGRVKVVAREDPDSVPKKPVFVVNQGPGAASGVV